MNTRFKWLLLIFLLAAPVFAQNVRVDNVAFSSVQGFPFLPGATITICTAAGSGVPCTPTVTGTCLSISDAVCNQSATLTSDAFGNYGFWIQPGSYTYTVTKAGFGGFGPRALTLAVPSVGTGPGTFTNLTVSGKLSCKNFNNVPCVDGDNSQGWIGSDFGAWVNSAVASLPLVLPTINDGTHTYRQGAVYLFPPAAGGPITVSTTISVNSPSVRLIGTGSSSLILSCPASGDCIRFTTNPFNQTPGAEVSGMTLVGNSTAASGLHMGDLTSLKWTDLYIKNFTSTVAQDGTGSAGAVGLWVDNVLGFTERAHYDRVSLDTNTIGMKLTNSSSGCVNLSSSFSYWAGSGWFNFRVNAGQIGFESGAGLNIGHGIYNIQMNGNSNGTKTFFQWDAASGACATASVWTGATLHFHTEDTNNGGGTYLSIASGAVLGGTCDLVNFQGAPAMTNTLTGTLACQYPLGPPQSNSFQMVLDSRNFSGNSEFFNLDTDKSTTDSILELSRNCTGSCGDLWIGAVGTAGDGVTGTVAGDAFIRQNNASGNLFFGSQAVPIMKMSPTTVTLPNSLTATPGQQPGAIIPMVCSTSQKTESAADASVLSCTPAATSGSYRVRFVLSLSAANAATLGWTATWKDSNSNAQSPTNLPLFQSGTAAPALTFTTSAAGNYYGYIDVDVDSSQTAIVIKLTFSGTSFAGKASATVERII